MWGEQFLGIVRWGCGENSFWVGVRWGLWGGHGHCSTVLCSAASEDLVVVAVGGTWLLGELWEEEGLSSLHDTQRTEEPRDSVAICGKPSGPASDSQM